MSARVDGSGWAARVYEHDKQTSEICRHMQQVGFRFDTERASQLAATLHKQEDDARERINRIARYEINPLSPNQLQWAFFEQLNAPVYFISSLTRRPSLGVDAMRGYAACGRPELRSLALAVLEYRRARKLRRTYIEGVHVGSDGRVHPTWLNYGTVSGRFSCQGPNLQNLPHPSRDPTISMGGVRSLYVASPGHTLIYWDYSQLEMRIAAYFSGDPAMIAACEGGDLHAGNARMAFGDAFDFDRYMQLKADGTAIPESLSFLRQLAKSAGFAICYGAAATTVWGRIRAEGKDVKLQQVEAMLRGLRVAFRVYYQFQDRRLMKAIKDGWVESPLLGRRRQVGHDPDATLVMNMPIQSGAADVENRKLVETLRRLDAMDLGVRHVPLVAQVHDANVLEVPDRHLDTVESVVRSVCAEPVVFDTSGTAYEVVFPIELERLQRWH